MTITTHFKSALLATLFASIILLTPHTFAHAAEISFSTVPTTPDTGEDFTIIVRLNTQDDTLNVVEGLVTIPPEFVVEEVHAGGSGLTVWPAGPTFSPNNTSVEFTGGTPGGVLPHSNILLFSVIAKATSPGTFTLGAVTGKAHKHDGEGGAVTLTAQPLEVTITTSVASPLEKESDMHKENVKKDRTAPTFVALEVGQEPELFDGQKYVTFFAHDDQSSISHYEVKEGLFGRYARAERYYVLNDQTRSSIIRVRVVDASGNTRVETIFPQHLSMVSIGVVAVILILIAVAAWWWYRRKK